MEGVTAVNFISPECLKDKGTTDIVESSCNTPTRIAFLYLKSWTTLFGDKRHASYFSHLSTLHFKFPPMITIVETARFNK